MKRFIALALIVTVMFSAAPAAFAEGDGRIVSLQQEAEQQLKEEMSAFEITAGQRTLAAANEAGYPVLDAGRGNPNWINTQARYAFTRFSDFAIRECELDMSEGSMAGHARQDGIGKRFDAAMDPENDADAFLITAVDWCVNTLELDKDALLKEWADAVIGDYYPDPSRCLPFTEMILNAYLQSTLYHGADLAGETMVFPTEGGSAAMVYIFDVLSHNCLLQAGDRIAIATPIFTPYLEIPSINHYGLVSIDVISSEANDWEIADVMLKLLRDPENPIDF